MIGKKLRVIWLKKLTKLILFFCIIIPGLVLGALSPIQSITPFKNVQGRYNCVAFTISKFGKIYLVNESNNQIYLIDKDGAVRNSAGGYGWGQNLFNTPVDITTRNGLNFYIADYNNRRIVRYDKQLNYIGEMGKAYEFYPISVEVSRFSRLYILDDDQDRVLQFGSKKELISIIGGNEYDKFNIHNPIDMEITKNGLLILEKSRILIFDRRGTPQNVFNLDMKIADGSISFIENNYLITDEKSKQIYIIKQNNTNQNTIGLLGIRDKERITDCEIKQAKIYILTSSGRILYYQKSELLRSFKKEDVSH